MFPRHPIQFHDPSLAVAHTWVRDRQWDALHEMLAPALAMRLTPEGFLQAAERPFSGQDPTHYDAVWVRDSVWGYLALRLDQSQRADFLLGRLLDYMASPDQLARLRRVIQDPSIASGSGGLMNVLHIRFDGRSRELQDILVDGKPQTWNHKQNDAIGLLFQQVVERLHSVSFVHSLSDAAWEFILLLPHYLDSLAYERMEDAGAWEEIERRNTSSIALVVSSLERWMQRLEESAMRRLATEKAERLGLEREWETLLNGKLNTLIDRGYHTVFSQLSGGESPGYPQTDRRFRKSDAALLNLIYPCSLARLREEHALQVFEHIAPLVRDVGVCRYLGDAYQSGNYWQGAAAPADAPDPRTSDCSDSGVFDARTQALIPGTEAQWFFDSWISLAWAKAKHRFGKRFESERTDWQSHFLLRSIGQITAPGMLGADGKSVPSRALPESYNTLVDRSGERRVPSPITPLNWAKASLRLALEACRTC